ncbi:MAG: TRAP transporter substrate-binding protein [Bilophila wadsworthia]
MRKFGEILKELSGGKYDVQVFPNSQLGKEDAYIASTRKGIIQMCATGTQTSAIQPSMAMLETPMLFDDYAHARRAMNGGKTFELITNGFTEKSGMRVLNAFPLGFRHFYTKKPVATIDDMKHLRMRVPNIPLYINCQGMRHQRPAHAFAEVTGALDQGVIDGGDSPSDIVSIKMYETTPEITLTGHLLVIHSLYINEKFYQSLPEQDKKWIDEAAKRSADYVWDLVEKVDADAVKTITEAGGHVSEPSPELHKFMQDAGKRSWKLFYDTVPNAKEILDSADSYRQASNVCVPTGLPAQAEPFFSSSPCLSHGPDHHARGYIMSSENNRSCRRNV